jgi:hypothetical protein
MENMRKEKRKITVDTKRLNEGGEKGRRKGTRKGGRMEVNDKGFRGKRIGKEGGREVTKDKKEVKNLKKKNTKKKKKRMI